MSNLYSGLTPEQESPNFPHRLVSTSRIEGATVFNRDGERLGTISRLMADNQSGQIEFAVLALGGFLGMGESQHPLPWSLLAHDTRRGGYVLDLDKGMLRGAPSYHAGTEPGFDQAYARRISGYYTEPRPQPQSQAQDIRP